MQRIILKRMNIGSHWLEQKERILFQQCSIYVSLAFSLAINVILRQ